MNEKFNLAIDVVRPQVDPTWSFMTIDHDGKIRMDPSLPVRMKGLVDSLNNGAWDKYDLVGGTDPDADRHGIVCPNWGVMNPNHYIAVCVEYLFGGNRPGWPEGAGIGKTLVSSSLIDAWPLPSTPSSLRFRSASSGSLTRCSRAKSPSAAKRAPA